MFVAPNQSWAESISFSNPRDEWLHVVELFNYSDKLTNPPNIGFDLWPKEEKKKKLRLFKVSQTQISIYVSERDGLTIGNSLEIRKS